MVLCCWASALILILRAHIHDVAWLPDTRMHYCDHDLMILTEERGCSWLIIIMIMIMRDADDHCALMIVSWAGRVRRSMEGLDAELRRPAGVCM